MISNVTIYLLLTCCIGLGGLALWVTVQKGRLQSEIESLKTKLLQRESHSHEPVVRKTKVKEVRTTQSESEINDLRREASRLREDVKKQREETRRAEQGSKDKVEALLLSVEKLSIENKAMLDSLKERTTQSKSVDAERLQAVAVEKSEVKKANDEIAVLRRHCHDLEKRLRGAMQAIESKSVDSEMLGRWKDRALEGRRMYQMMRYMRELSDDKLTSYQDGLVTVCSELIKKMGHSLPEAKSGTVAADLLLGTTLGLMQPPQNELSNN